MVDLSPQPNRVQGADCVWHIAALVGPYFDKKDYEAVNYRRGPAPTSPPLPHVRRKTIHHRADPVRSSPAWLKRACARPALPRAGAL